MAQIYEVELRYKLEGGDQEASSLEKKLFDQGFTPADAIHQEDIYYSSKHNDFIESEECLRIRTVGESSEITWKPPSHAEMKEADEFWKEEVDLQIGLQREVAQRLLSSLDFFEVAVVDKRRRSFISADNVEVSIDSVKGVGTFVELEVKHSEPDAGKRIIREVAGNLGLSENAICRTPYRDLVREAQRGE